MAQYKTPHELTAFTEAPAGADEVVVWDVSAQATKKATIAQFAVTVSDQAGTDQEIADAVTAHSAATDPHGDRAYAAGLVTAHTGDTDAAHAASAISYAGSTNLSATTVEAALDELDAEKAALRSVLPVFDIRAYGAVVNGSTDDTTAVQAALQAAYNAGGGIVFFPVGVCRINGQLTVPTDGATQATTRPIELIGAGAMWSGRSTSGFSSLLHGSVLDLRYSGSNAKIVTTGYGRLKMSGLTLTDQGTSTTPFILTTWTTLLLSDLVFEGNPTKSQATCDQDAIVLGGTTTTMTGGVNAPFQGYGTVIERCYFSRIRRGVYGRSYSNAITVRDNCWWATCGGSTAIEFDGGGDSINYSIGGTISNNLIECIAYDAAIVLSYTSNMAMIANHFYDASGIDTAYIMLGTNATYNLIIAGHYTSTKPLVNTYTNNTVIDYVQSQPSSFSEPVNFTNAIGPKFRNIITVDQTAIDLAKTEVYPASIRMYNSAGAITFRVDNSTGIITATGGTFGGQIVGNGFNLGPSIWERTGTGGAMKIDSGTGGSYLTLENYGVIINDHTGAQQMIFGAGGANINATGTNTLRLQHAGTDRVTINSTGMGFFAATPVAKPTVTGSRSDGTALASLLTALANLGLITNSSTA